MELNTTQNSVPAPTQKTSGGGLFLGAILTGLIVGVLIVLGFLTFGLKKAPDYSTQLSAISANLEKSLVIKENEKQVDPKLDSALQNYQAVFLNNGQVYFAKFKTYNSEYAVLTDIFYMQNDNGLQSSKPAYEASPQISLVKLGNELHGPQDAMYVLKSSVMFVENLKADGQVMKAIQAYKAN